MEIPELKVGMEMFLLSQYDDNTYHKERCVVEKTSGRYDSFPFKLKIIDGYGSIGLNENWHKLLGNRLFLSEQEAIDFINNARSKRKASWQTKEGLLRTLYQGWMVSNAYADDREEIRDKIKDFFGVEIDE